MKIRFMKDRVVSELKNNLKKYLKKYRSDDNSWICEEWTKEYKKNFQNIELDMSKKSPSDTDFENIKRIYTGLKGITDGQACDERLWAGLCHDKFWKYVQYRWPVSKNEDDGLKEVEQHYFLTRKHGETRSLMLNAISRLWWYGRLTYDEDAEDPFILTEYLSKDLNGRGFMLFGSNFSNNIKITKTFLCTLMKYEESDKLSREEFNEVRRIVNLWGGKIILDSLSEEALSEKILDFIKKMKQSKN